MPVILTWTGPQTVAQKGLLICCYSAEEVQAWNFLQLNYYTSWYIKTPIPATFALNIGPDSSPKDSPANWLICYAIQGKSKWGEMKPFSKVIHIYKKIFLCRRQRKNPLPQL